MAHAPAPPKMRATTYLGSRPSFSARSSRARYRSSAVSGVRSSSDGLVRLRLNGERDAAAVGTEIGGESGGDGGGGIALVVCSRGAAESGMCVLSGINDMGTAWATGKPMIR